MKQIITLLSFLVIGLCVHADESCDILMKEAKADFNKGLYPSAKDKFNHIKTECNYYDRTCDYYIKKCEDKINAEKQHRPVLEGKIIKEKGEKAAREFAKEREKNRYVYLSVNSTDVPGKFSSNLETDLKSGLLKNNIKTTNDSLQAYWYVRVAVSIFDESSNGESHYRVYASAEVENAIECDFETKTYSVDRTGCCDTEMNVANEIYESKSCHLFKDIENNIIRLLDVNIVHNGKNVGSSSLNNPINVAVDVTSDQNCSVTVSLKSRLENNFDHTGGRYIVLNRDGELKRDLDEWIDAYENRNVPSNQRILKGNEMGIDKVCIVKISEANDGLRFSSDFIDMATGEKKTAFYSTSDNYPKVCCSSSIDRVHIVADELTRQLEIPSSNLKDLDKRIDEIKRKEAVEDKRIQDSLDRVRRKDIASSFVPGLYQLRNNKKLGGGLIIAGEALGIGSAIVSHNMRGVYIKKMNSTTNANLKKEYADRANACTIVRNVSIGAAAAVYVWNLVDAWSSIHKQKKNSFTKGTVCLNPMITDQSVALSLSINF